MNLALLHTDIADCWLRKNIQSGLLLGSWNKWQRIGMPHYFSWFMAYYLQTSLFISIYETAVGNTPSGVCERGFSRTVKLWENRDLRVLPVITYIYLWERIYASCLSYFSNCPAVIEQKLNWRDNLPISFYLVQTFVLIYPTVDTKCGSVLAAEWEHSVIQGVPGGMCQTLGECSLC